MAKPIELPFGVWTQMSPGVELDLSKGRGIVGGDIPVHVQTWGGRRTQRYSQGGSSSAAFGYQYCREWNCCDSMCLPGSTDRVQPGLLEPLLFPLSSVGRGGGAESGVDATGWWGAGRQGGRRLGWRFLPLQHFFNINSIVYLPSVLWRCWLGGRKGIRPVKNWVVGCWCCYLSGARCRLAYFPADSTATHCLLLQ